MDYPVIDPSSLPQRQGGMDSMKEQLVAALMKQSAPQGGPNATKESTAYDAINTLAQAYAQKALRERMQQQNVGAQMPPAQASPVQGWGNPHAQALPPMNAPQAPAQMPVVGPQSNYMP